MLYRQTVGFRLKLEETITYFEKVKSESFAEKKSGKTLCVLHEGINTDAATF